MHYMTVRVRLSQHLDVGPCPVVRKQLVEIEAVCLAGDGGSIPEGAKCCLQQLEEPHAHGTTTSLRLTWQLFASFFKRHSCKRALCIHSPCGGSGLGHSQDRSCLYKEGLAARATLPSLKATRVVALAIETERFAPRAPLGCSRKCRAYHLLGYERLQPLSRSSRFSAIPIFLICCSIIGSIRALCSSMTLFDDMHCRQRPGHFWALLRSVLV